MLSVGYLFDDRRAAQFKALTGADIAFAMGGLVRASTLDPGAATVLQNILHAPRSPRIVIGDAEYVALTQPLSSMPSSRSDGNHLAFANRSHAYAGIDPGGSGRHRPRRRPARVVVSYLVARTITRPLATITDHMRLVAKTGDLTSKIATKGPAIWHDEDALMVATTFNTLTDSIATFQREAGQRERLSSLGRLSTVIAHEVRNPLMIIKGALRTMAKPGANDADVRDAANDIDQETDRLNRLVTDVLDVARPIHVEPAPTDMNAVCRDAAAAAAAADGTRAQIALELAKTLPTIVTDGERLRTVLVNLLTNAHHAVDNPGAAQPTPPINGQRPAVSIITEPTLRSTRRHHGSGSRNGHRRRGPGAHLRAILHDAPRRHRPWPGHFKEHHRRSWWHHWRRLETGRRHRLSCRARRRTGRLPLIPQKAECKRQNAEIRASLGPWRCAFCLMPPA